MRDFRELKVWVRAHQLTLAVYPATADFPKTEMYALASQIRRAASSSGANIAEGAAKTSKADFARFLEIALGSTAELEYHLLLSRDLGFISSERHVELNDRVGEVKRMLTGFIQHLRAEVRRLS